MARLFEFQCKELLRKAGIATPRGEVATSLEEVREIATKLGGPVAIKAQAWITGRAQAGGIKFADNPQSAVEQAEEVLGGKIGSFKVEQVLIEEQLEIEREFYMGFIIDDTVRGPIVIFSSVGGTGVEEIKNKYPGKIKYLPVSLKDGLRIYEACNLIRKTGIGGKLQLGLARILVNVFKLAVKYEARSMEINPLALTKQGELIALDCRLTVDDNAVFRHPELGIEIAREYDRPATQLEKIAYQVEKDDYRGTFYFYQMETNPVGEGYIGFHGGGGGGSMMAMDALIRHGFKLLNFCDTSGNPAASKVYRAAKIILTQPKIQGYFHSGSGVASQEQFHTARGMVKAFRELNLSVPAVIRIGGNSEEEAIRILTEYTSDLPGIVEAYGRDTSVDFCVHRLKELVEKNKRK